MFKTFEVALGKEVRAFVNGITKVFKAGETFAAHEIGVGEEWLKKHLGHGVKEVQVPAVVENSISAPVVVNSANGQVVPAPDSGEAVTGESEAGINSDVDAAAGSAVVSGPVNGGVPA